MQLYTRYYKKAIIDRKGYVHYQDTVAYILTDNITPWNYGLVKKFKLDPEPEAWDLSSLTPEKMYEEEI